MKQESDMQVLMIDDDENDAMLVRHMVGKMPDSGCQFHWAASYDQGLIKLAEIHWDLCLVDYNLGSHTGVQIVKEARARGVACPFLLLTGMGSRDIDIQAMRAGVKGYLEKDRLCPRDLERAIRYAVGGVGGQKSANPVSSRIPPRAVELMKYGYVNKVPFVVIALMLNRETFLRNHLSTRHLDGVNTALEDMVRDRLSEGEALFRVSDGALLLVSTTQESREARQFLATLLAEPLALTGDDRGRTVSLPVVVRRNVFDSSVYSDTGGLVADLEAFIGPPSQTSQNSEIRPHNVN